MSLPLAELVTTIEEVRTEGGRNAKAAIIADLLRRAGEDAGLAARYLVGDPPQDRLEIGYSAVRDADVPPADSAALVLADVDEAFTRLADAGGEGSRGARLATLRTLLARATAEEQTFLRHLVLGDMRQGALEGVVVKATALAAGVPEAAVRRALMLAADLAHVIDLALAGGREALDAVGLTVGRGIQPMLASTAVSVSAALADMGPAVVEPKLDGARIQVHVDGTAVHVLTRNLNDITGRSPDVVAAALGLGVQSAILDGEVLAVGDDGIPWAFQDTMSAFSRRTGARPALSPFFFDIVHLDGRDLLDEPLHVRRRALETVVPEWMRVPSTEVDDPDAAEAIADDALARGHEGVMVKEVDSPYAAGRRGRAWRKVKPVRTLDLVVLAVEWGSGRRQGKLSNLHLGARSDDDDGFVMLGKTFKGMTDAMLEWQTARFLDLEVSRDGHVVVVRPEQVVEIALDGIQVSRRYPGGVALRFARVLRYRDDKQPEEADTLATVRAIGGLGAPDGDGG